MTITNDDELEGLRRAGRVVAEARDRALAEARAGVTTRELDDVVREVLERHGANSAPKVTYGFPGCACISVNEVAAHGIPDDRPLASGDLVHVDVSAEVGGFFADTGACLVVPDGQPRQLELVEAGREALDIALRSARAGRAMRDMGKAVERFAARRGFSLIRDLAGHGIGRALHEEPRDVLCWAHPAERRRFEAGQVIAIEPFLTTGATTTRTADDGWSLVNGVDVYTAQFEHTVVITRGRPIVLTAAA